MEGLPAALLLDGTDEAIELKLTLPAASTKHLASLEEATARCKSGVSIMIIPKVRAGIDFLTSPDLVLHIGNTFDELLYHVLSKA